VLGLAVRAMRRRPAFTLALMLTLALGIGTHHGDIQHLAA
jgi:hypothetical protein